MACRVDGATRSPQCRTTWAPRALASATAEASRRRWSCESDTRQIFIKSDTRGKIQGKGGAQPWHDYITGPGLFPNGRTLLLASPPSHSGRGNEGEGREGAKRKGPACAGPEEKVALTPYPLPE